MSHENIISDNCWASEVKRELGTVI